MLRNLIAAALVLLPGLAFALTFDDVASRVAEVDSVRLAEYELGAARVELRAAGYAGDAGLGFTPATSTSVDEQGLRTVSVSAGATLSVPVGLGADASLRAEQAADRLVAAERAAGYARDEALARLYTLYHDAWLAQEELSLLDAELRVAELELGIAGARFDEGAITLAELGGAAEAAERAQTARDQGTLAHRLAWLELAFAAGLDPADQQVLEAELDFSAEPPKPPELSEWAAARDPGILAQTDLVARIRAELAADSSRFSISTTRLSLSLFDHGLSVSYASANPSVSASYSSPSVDLYSSAAASASAGTSQSSAAPFSVGLSATLSYGGAREQTLEREALELDLAREEYRLAALADELDFRIRATYQQMHRAIDAVAQAERAEASARSNLTIVEARAEAGRAGEVDLMRAELAVERARYDLTAARIAREEAMLQAVLAASYFTEHYPHLTAREGVSE